MKNQVTRLTEKVIAHMAHMQQRRAMGGILLTGSPGVGKTTFVEMLGSLLGMKTVVIEVPHITEEHLINIPFVVFNPQTNSQQTHVSQMTPEYKLVLAQSNLFAQIASARAMSDAEYIAHIKQSPNYIQQMYMQFGGTEQQIPEIFQEARQHFGCLLFLDEFYRQTSVRIRNILRGILNNKIGLHTIPSNVYIMYASNMHDTGLEDIPSNQQFTAVEYRNPTKKDWFDWLVAKFNNDQSVKLNPQIVTKFKACLADEDLSHTDIEKEVRTSPRRWEQVLLYLNASLPCKDSQEARSLLTNIKNNFIHYQSEQHSTLADKVIKAVVELIQETSGVQVSESDTLPDTEWRDALMHSIKQAMTLGKHRKHIPVVSGPPGIGKEQSLTSKILTPTGWKLMGDMKVGDKVVTPCGDIAKVTGVFPQGIKDIYTITFHDGSSAECGLEHLWKIHASVGADRTKAQPMVVTTEKIMQMMQQYNGRKNVTAVSIPLVQPFETPQQPLEIDPYLLGALIGDGSLSMKQIGFTSNDQEIVKNVRLGLHESQEMFKLEHESSNDYDYRIRFKQEWMGSKNESPLVQSLKNLNLYGHRAWEKFIPEVYKLGSIEQRWELLRGLMDTDGFVTQQGRCSYVSVSSRLAHDVQELIWSLGGCASIMIRRPTYTYKGEKRKGRIAYEVIIAVPEPKKLFKLSRKKDRAREVHADGRIALRRRVKSIELTSREEAQCIMVDHPDHLYVTDNYVVTHNTTQALAAANQFNLRLIDIDVGEIYADDTVGLPIPGKRTGDDIAVKFSMPKLYHQIMNIIKEREADYHNKLIEKHGEAEAQKIYAQYEKQKWKYLIFFDEINRVDEKTFNALRRVILEKNFGPSGEDGGEPLRLPEGSVVVAAMNPEGTGTSELTSHFRDVIDVIPAKASWRKTRSWMINDQDRAFKGVSPEVKSSAIQIMDEFIKKFRSHDSKYGPDQAPFYLDLGGTEIYVSPREYSDMFSTLIRELNGRMKQVLNDLDIDANQMRNELDEAVGEALEDSLNFIFYKHQFEKDEFIATLRKWVHSLDDQLFLGVISRKAKNVSTLESVLGQYLTGTNPTKMADDIDVINANNSINHAQFIDAIKDAFMENLTDDQSVKKIILDETHPKVEIKGDKLVSGSEKASNLTNFVLALLYCLHIHQYTNDRLVALSKAISQAASERKKTLTASGKIDEDTKSAWDESSINLRSAVHDLISSL